MAGGQRHPNGRVRVSGDSADPPVADQTSYLLLQVRGASLLEELHQHQLPNTTIAARSDMVSHVPPPITPPPTDPNYSTELQFAELELQLRSSLDDVRWLASSDMPERIELSRLLHEYICDKAKDLLAVLSQRVEWERSNDVAIGYGNWQALNLRVDLMSRSLPTYLLAARLGGKSVKTRLPLWMLPRESARGTFVYFSDLADFTRCVAATARVSERLFTMDDFEQLHILIGEQYRVQDMVHTTIPRATLQISPTSPPASAVSERAIEAHSTLRNAMMQAMYMVARFDNPDRAIPEGICMQIRNRIQALAGLHRELPASDDNTQRPLRVLYTRLANAAEHQFATFESLLARRNRNPLPTAAATANPSSGADRTQSRRLHTVYVFGEFPELGRVNELLHQLPLIRPNEIYEIETFDVNGRPVALVWLSSTRVEGEQAIRNSRTGDIGGFDQQRQVDFLRRHYLVDDMGASWPCFCRSPEEVGDLEDQLDSLEPFNGARRICTCFSAAWTEAKPGELRLDVPRGGSVVIRLNANHVLNGRKQQGLEGA